MIFMKANLFYLEQINSKIKYDNFILPRFSFYMSQKIRFL